MAVKKATDKSINEPKIATKKAVYKSSNGIKAAANKAVDKKDEMKATTNKAIVKKDSEMKAVANKAVDKKDSEIKTMINKSTDISFQELKGGVKADVRAEVNADAKPEMNASVKVVRKKRRKFKKVKTEIVPVHVGKDSVHYKRKRRQRIKQVAWVTAIVVFIVLFFTFGLIAEAIFGPNHDVTKLANENIVAAINIVHFLQNSGALLLKSLSAIFVSLIVIFLLSFLVKFIGAGSNRRKTIASILNSFIKYIGFIIMIGIVLSICGVNTAAILAGVGIVGIIIGLGAQSLISDILAGLFIVFENNYQVGDIVTIDGFRGEVINIGLRTTRIKDIGGDVKIVNNSQIKSLINMTQHSSFAVCDLTIGYGENMEKVEKVILDNLGSVANKLGRITEGPFYKNVIEFNDRGVVLRIAARCDEKDRIQLTRDMNRELKLVLDKNKIQIAVPQVEINK